MSTDCNNNYNKNHRSYLSLYTETWHGRHQFHAN